MDCRLFVGRLLRGNQFAELGFDHVTLDLEGYRTGSVSPESEDEPLVEDVFAQEYPSDD